LVDIEESGAYTAAIKQYNIYAGMRSLTRVPGEHKKPGGAHFKNPRIKIPGASQSTLLAQPYLPSRSHINIGEAPNSDTTFSAVLSFVS